MNLTDVINQDIKDAMRAREKEKLEALRAIKAALIIEATKEGGNGSVSADAEMGIIKKLFKQRNDAARIYIEQGRDDLAKTEEFQANVIKVYLPAQMSEQEIRNEVVKTISSLGATGPSDMGKVMGAVMSKLSGKADGAVISQTVKNELMN